MRPTLFLTAAAVLVASAAPAQPPKKPSWYDKAVKKVEATFEPAEAKPGQTVTFRLTVELNEGYYTYPTRQPEKLAAALVNKIAFPEPGAVVFVGTVTDPPKFKKVPEPEVGIREKRICTGKVVYERTAVVSPTQKPGTVSVKLPEFRLSVCDETDCFPAKKLTPEAALKVLDGPAVPVEEKYAAEVKKAAGGM